MLNEGIDQTRKENCNTLKPHESYLKFYNWAKPLNDN